MARKTTTTKAEPVDEGEEAPPNPTIVAMESMASLVETTVMNAVMSGVPIGLTVFGLTVRINDYGDISMEGGEPRGGNHLFFAAQAGLLLGTARAAAEIERD